MNEFVIKGGVPLNGEVRISGNKNAVLPMIAAAILTDKEIILRNVPDIIDVRVMLELISLMGVESDFSDGVLRLRAAELKTTDLPREFCSRIRTSLLFAGPLLARVGRASMWPPGGDVIGRRRLDGHFYGLKSLGADVRCDELPFRFELKKKLKGRDLFLDEASVTATEQIMLTAVLASGRTFIRNAAAEPHVVSLGDLLVKMGAKIEGLGTNTIVIDGVPSLGGADHVVEGDHIEAGSFLAMAAATGGGVTLRGIVPKHYWMTRRVFEKFGVKFQMRDDWISMSAGQSLRIEPDFGNAIPVVSDGPWPQFPTDLMSCMIVMATQAKGSALFFEKMFESRIYFVDRLISMGANAIVCDPHRAVISGPAKLHGAELSSPDIRAGMALLIAALCAKGESRIRNCDVICRGYENIVEKIKKLGGNIEKS